VVDAAQHHLLPSLLLSQSEGEEREKTHCDSSFFQQRERGRERISTITNNNTTINWVTAINPLNEKSIFFGELEEI
jgi:hypothetical protein